MEPAAALLFPGAGTGATHPGLVAIEDALAPMPVVRADFPDRKQGRRAPDRAPKLVAAVVEEAQALARRESLPPESIVLGGRSMGGRMCSIAVAEGLPARALVLVAYPLHPPGKPERLRTEHLPSLGVPCLFVSGTRDPFGTPDELEAATAAIPAPVSHAWLDGARHDLKDQDAHVAAIVTDWIRRLQ
jgi:uncharacterized protein